MADGRSVSVVIATYNRPQSVSACLKSLEKQTVAPPGSDAPFYSLNSFCFHSHFFSFRRLKELLAGNGFRIVSAAHSDLGILPEWSWLRGLKRIECRLADIVPHSLAGGWLLVVGRQGKV